MTSALLRFLADENCDFAVVRALREAGYNVLAMSEMASRTIDSDLIRRSAEGRRILITEDKDFGWLVFASHAEPAGVILIRFPGDARGQLADAVLQTVEEQGERLFGAFVVIQPGVVRISRRPERQQ